MPDIAVPTPQRAARSRFPRHIPTLRNLTREASAAAVLPELGARHVETAASVNQTITAINRSKPDFALLDLSLDAAAMPPYDNVRD